MLYIIFKILKMKTELKAKFIQYLNQRKNEHGFTLVELLVVIIVIGILAAVSLPNFLNQSAKAKQTEAKQIISTINRSQTTYRTENDRFATSFNLLSTGILVGDLSFTTVSYTYVLTASQDTTSITATPGSDSSLKSYLGTTIRFFNAQSVSVSANIVCESLESSSNVTLSPAINISATTATEALKCPALSKQL
jgi:type IV pilus assembly protein PilA